MKKSYKHVLLADDDLDDCEFFAEVFTRNFPDVKLSVSGDGGKLMSLLGSPPDPAADLIFLDLNMPIMSGPECLEKIRNSETLKDNIVIIFSTSSSQADIEKMYSLGANYFITKPSDFNDLKKIISKALAVADQTQTSQPAFENFYIKL